ncbi:sporulation protein YqfC [Paenactinomyces guangxiensis]|uniref:Sporulation protein YqfC n=1 Tax=Paenactinomyces guangxiensis TaxID=1490290 RepID=A0A7W1WNT4_9BACL|nr:sporulation protein YqfC [Paenactinomyces guangxiensis]MBA4493154.1 sporulation protein YqfC [Paenactinomyces guangxiensis]MBH8589996.1 sporulation protein YqfC [Paenactinomyces guangxiensis]
MGGWRGHMRKWASEWFDLPPDLTSEVPRIEMIGPFRLQVENHRGMYHFSNREIKLKIHQGSIIIAGENLMIKAIYPEVVLIEGTIHELRYEK